MRYFSKNGIFLFHIFLEEIDELIDLYTETGFFERAEAFSIMKRELEKALLELVKEQKQ